MNAEKELLLALLIEKYTMKTQQTQKIEKPAQFKKRQRKTRGKIHRWTNAEKQHLIAKRSEGHSFRLIAGVMGLRVSQVENMYYTITAREVAVK
jgi:hypothetical protein